MELIFYSPYFSACRVITRISTRFSLAVCQAIISIEIWNIVRYNLLVFKRIATSTGHWWSNWALIPTTCSSIFTCLARDRNIAQVPAPSATAHPCPCRTARVAVLRRAIHLAHGGEVVRRAGGTTCTSHVTSTRHLWYNHTFTSESIVGHCSSQKSHLNKLSVNHTFGRLLIWSTIFFSSAIYRLNCSGASILLLWPNWEVNTYSWGR